MSDEAALLRAICEHPDEDTPRLVFADWLSEQGGPVNVAWANGIRAQIWRSRGDTAAALAQQSRVFESGYGRTRLNERLGVPEGLVGRWERGFPVHAAGHFRWLRDAWPRLAFRVPVRKLHVYEVSAAGAAELVTWPALSVLSELELWVAWESPQPCDVLPLLVGCAGLNGLVALAVSGAFIDDAGVTALLDSPHFARLKSCTLRYACAPGAISLRVHDRIRSRFGPDSVLEDDVIPF